MRTITITSVMPIRAFDEEGNEVTGIRKFMAGRDQDPISISINESGALEFEYPPLVHEIEFIDGSIEQVHLVRAK